MSQLLALMALGLVSGLLIGCIGIGGVILVPALVFHRRDSDPARNSCGAACLHRVGCCCDRDLRAGKIDSLEHGGVAVYRGCAGSFCRCVGGQELQRTPSGSPDRCADDGIRHQFATPRTARRVRKETHSHTAVIADRRRHRVRFIAERHGRATCPRSDPDGVQSPGAHRYWAQSGHPASDRGRWQPRQLSLWRTRLVSRFRTGTGADDRVLAGSKACA